MIGGLSVALVPGRSAWSNMSGRIYIIVISFVSAKRAQLCLQVYLSSLLKGFLTVEEDVVDSGLLATIEGAAEVF